MSRTQHVLPQLALFRTRTIRHEAARNNLEGSPFTILRIDVEALYACLSQYLNYRNATTYRGIMGRFRAP